MEAVAQSSSNDDIDNASNSIELVSRTPCQVSGLSEEISPTKYRVSGCVHTSTSSSSLSTVDDLDLVNETEALLFGPDDKPQGRRQFNCFIKARDKKDEESPEQFDVSAYANSRKMTPLQERINALTVLPNPIYCLYFLLAGNWLSDQAIEVASSDIIASGSENEINNARDWLDSADSFALFDVFGIDTTRCVNNSFLPNLYAMPPLPVMAVAIGIILHAPFSFLYHWVYAHRLPPGPASIEHWSRRLDQSFIHVISAFMSYGTSGRWDYFFVNALFNIDCIYRQFKRKVHPRRNKIRIFISAIAYTIPILRRGETMLFIELWALFLASGWLFATYPIKGWSHSAFHAVIAFVPPLLMRAACDLLASEAQITAAARCAVLAGKSRL